MDTLVFYVTSVGLTLTLTVYPLFSWLCAPFVALLLLKRYKPPARGSANSVFKLVKFVSSIVALLIVNALQWGYDVDPGYVEIILQINMAEAIIVDVMRVHGVPNALVGILLSVSCHPMIVLPTKDGVFLSSLSMEWIFFYTVWNAIFVYGSDFSWSFQLILVTPLIVCVILQTHHAWLGARTYSLVVNQILRGIQALWMFEPGRTYITHTENHINPNKHLCVIFGIANLLLYITNHDYYVSSLPP